MIESEKVGKEMQKSYFLLLLVHLAVYSGSHALSFAECCDTIKNSVVSRLPEKWQKKADRCFWPGVSACAALTAIGVYYVLREPREPREIFTDFLFELRGTEMPISRKLIEGDYSVAMATIDESDWNGTWSATAASVHLKYRSMNLHTCMLTVPFASLDNPSVYEIVDVAMQRLANV